MIGSVVALGNLLAAADPNTVASAASGGAGLFFGHSGSVLALGLAAFGSAIGIGLAGRSAAGAWAKEAKAGRTLSFTYIILLGMPTSQLFYALIVMMSMQRAITETALTTATAGTMLGIGIATGIAEMLSAWMQGLIGASGIRALSEGEGKGFVFIIIAMGIAETIGILAMVFLLGSVPG
jgi:V/A-type H+-transporting ATPase subunit K